MIIIPIAIALSIITILFISYKEKMTFTNIKISNIEEKINSTLVKRKELLKDSENIIKDVIKTQKQIYLNLSHINIQKEDMIESDRKLKNMVNEFYLIDNRYQKLREDERFQKIYYSISETEDLLSAYKNYYNNVCKEYNKLINSFPLVIASKIKGKKQKLFFDNETAK